MTRESPLNYRLDDLWEDPEAFFMPPDGDPDDEEYEDEEEYDEDEYDEDEYEDEDDDDFCSGTCSYCGCSTQAGYCPHCDEERCLMQSTYLPTMAEIRAEEFEEREFRSLRDVHHYDDYHGVLDDDW